MLFSSQACAPVDSITRPVEGRLTTQYAALVFVFLAFSLAAPAATAQESIVWGNSAGPWASGPSTVSNGSPPETWHDVSNTFTLEGTTTPRRLSIMFTGTGSAWPPPDSPLPWAGTAEVSVGGVAFLDDGSGEVAVWSHSDAFGPPAESTEPIGGSIGPMTAHVLVQPGTTYTLRVMNTGVLNFFDIGYYSTELTSEVSFARLHADMDATGNNDGTDWVNAFTDLQDALSIAVEGDEVWVAEGTYLPGEVPDVWATFAVPSGVALYGGFSGSESTRSERDWTTHPTILSGSVDPPHDYFGFVVTLTSAAETTVVDGFTIRDGSVRGVIIEGGAPVVSNSTIESNGEAGDGGGGVLLTGNAGPSFHDTTILGMSDRTAQESGSSLTPVQTCRSSRAWSSRTTRPGEEAVGCTWNEAPCSMLVCSATIRPGSMAVDRPERASIMTAGSSTTTPMNSEAGKPRRQQVRARSL